MKQGYKKFNAKTQGARSVQGQKVGENFVSDILNILNIKTLDKNKTKYSAIINEIKTKMSPDFVISPSETFRKKFGDIEKIFLESKFKQIPGSDWEKIESNFGYHDYFYNVLCKQNIKTIVILSGYWRKLQKNYNHFMSYFYTKYGKDLIFDFGESIEEIERFAKLMDIELTDEQKDKIKTIWEKTFNDI